ncbi:MAG: RnfABCDGE type electron transport complex subunit G [Bacillota bacterium]
MRRLIITLTILGIISAVVLAFVYEWTTPKIEEHTRAARESAILAVLPESDSFREVKKSGMVFYEGNKDNEVAMIISGGGFQGQIELMIGANPTTEKIYAIRVLNHSETPGLGANITGEKFGNNFTNKPFGEYEVVKKPVDQKQEPYKVEAISGATISSEKVTSIIEEAIKELKEVYGSEA